MAKLINGNGNKAIWAAQDADLIASICGNITSIAAVGSQFSYTQEDANTIGVSDGVIITKEGRRIQLDSGAIDLFTIPTGILGATSYYIIGYKLVQAADTVQTCETFVQKMDNSTDVIPEDTFKGGATEVYVSLYRVTQDGMNIDTVDLLLPKLSNVAQLISDLTANSNHFYFDYQNGKYGYNTDPNRGAGTFSPFKSGGDAEFIGTKTTTINRTGGGGTNTTTEITIPDDGKYLVCVSASAGSMRSYMGNGSSNLYKNNTNILSKTGGLVRGSGDSDYSYCNYSTVIDCAIGDKIKVGFSYTTHQTYPSTGLVQLDIWKVG